MLLEYSVGQNALEKFSLVGWTRNLGKWSADFFMYKKMATCKR